MLKTYRGDCDYANRLIMTYEKHNKENISLYIVVPSQDLNFFSRKRASHKHISVLNELDIFEGGSNMQPLELME